MKIDDEKCECFLIDITKRERCTNNWVLYLRKLLFFFTKSLVKKIRISQLLQLGHMLDKPLWSEAAQCRKILS